MSPNTPRSLRFQQAQDRYTRIVGHFLENPGRRLVVKGDQFLCCLGWLAGRQLLCQFADHPAAILLQGRQVPGEVRSVESNLLEFCFQ